MEHTKGKWRTSLPKIQEGFGNQTYFSIDTNFQESQTKFKTVGFYYPHSVQSEAEMIANAKLIASAPELLEALVETQKIIDNVILETPTGKMRDRITDLNIKAMAAIKNATT